MKVMTIFGTRPEIIRLSLIMNKLDAYCDHVTVHTGQNFDKGLSDIFLDQLKVRPPDEFLGVRAGSFGAQIGKILEKSEEVIRRHNPDKILILGDTNSALSAIVAARLGIPVFHMEAGNRCFDDRVPEEVNRRIIDHSSTILLPYTKRSKENLVDEGIAGDRIYVTGNPIFEVLEGFSEEIDSSSALDHYKVEENDYFLVTLHRSENVDEKSRFEKILNGFEKIAAKYKKTILVSVHPRTASKISEFGLSVDQESIKFLEPLGFFEFVNLEKNAFCVLTDSGTVQEECAIFRVPNVTVRDVTERPETIEAGSNYISGADSESMLRGVEIALGETSDWIIPEEYLAPDVSSTVTRIVLGYTSIRKHV